MSIFTGKSNTAATGTTVEADHTAARRPLPEGLTEFDSLGAAEEARIVAAYFDRPGATIHGATDHLYQQRLEHARTARENQIEADKFTKSMSSWMDCCVCGQGRACLTGAPGEDYGMCPPCGAVARDYQRQAVGTQPVRGGRTRAQAVLDHIRKAAANPDSPWSKHDWQKVSAS